MSRPVSRTRAAAGLAALMLAPALLGPNAAVAVDDTKPTPVLGCPSAKDNASDSVAPNTQVKHDSLEIVGFFSKHDPAKGADATTVNFTVKNLDTALPQGYTSKHWAAEWTAGEKTHFVRAVVDYTGAVAFEWGERIPETVPGTGTLPRYQYGGDTTGKLFEGPEGVVQIVIPPDLGAKAGNPMGTMLGSANGGYQVIPVAAKTPTRGISNPWDEATLPKWTVGPCAGAATGGGGGTGTPVTPPNTGATALPVEVLTKKVKAKKAKKSLAVKLRSSEKVSNLEAQLLKGKKVLGRAKLATLEGAKTLKLKVRKLKKGTYTLQLAGDSAGARRTSTAKIKVS